MPVYEYVCDAGHRFESHQGYDAAKITCLEITCPEDDEHTFAVPCAGTHWACGKPARRQAVQQVAGVIFKGGGFTRSGA